MKVKVESSTADSLKSLHCTQQDQLVKDGINKERIAAYFPKFSRCKRGLQHRRARSIKQQPTELSDLILEDGATVTSDGKAFLKFDNHSKTDRIIIFGCDESLKILAEAKQWHIDGTFKIAPKQLLQMVTIHAVINDHLIPLVNKFILIEFKFYYKVITKNLLKLGLHINFTKTSFNIQGCVYRNKRYGIVDRSQS